MKNKKMPRSLDFEIINVEPLNKYISECEIKVFYHGKNRNGSYISKAVGNQIANSLPRTPIVALYNEEVEDYEDHGEEITINSKGIKFEKKTIPYGAVDQYTPAVWEKFVDETGMEREYLVVRGFLWTGRYPHLEKVLEKPKGQSMEFFEESVEGNWARFDNEDDEFFIFNEADISALCILGDDVQPCFEEASIGKPEILYSLEKDEFTKEFNTFMFQLDEALQSKNSTEGGTILKKENKETFEEVVETETETEETDVEETEEVEETDVEEVETEEVELEEEVEEDTEFVELQADYALIKEELETLKTEFNALMEEKNSRELEEKEAICDKFAVLGEEALNEFKENLTKYTVEELEKELSVIAFQKGITFNLLTQKDAVVTPEPIKNTREVPAWVKAIEKKESTIY